MNRKVLWVGDAGVATGFERCTRAACNALHARGWEVRVLGINHGGDPHDYDYPVYPAARPFRREDAFGTVRLPHMVREHDPDVVVLLNDPWNIPAYMRQLECADYQGVTVGWIAVDGNNCRGGALGGLDLAVFWTQFAANEARSGGYEGASAVVPLGVDLEVFQARDRKEARSKERIGIERFSDSFIVGNVNRNQPRKRLDLTIQYFAEWVQEHGIEDAALFLHVCPTGDQGYDLRQLADYYGLAGRVVLSEPDIGNGAPEGALAWMYACMDAMITTTQGEGFGLTQLEGMACGIPQIVPDWSALGEWTQGAALRVPCTSTIATPNGINAIGGIADKAQCIAALDRLYRDGALRHELSCAGMKLASSDCYRWDNVGAAFVQAVKSVLQKPVLKVAS